MNIVMGPVTPQRFGMAFAIGIGLNVTFVAVEFVFGVLANSVSLLADADTTSPMCWVWSLPGSLFSGRPPSSRYTAACAVLRSRGVVQRRVPACVVGAIAWEAFLRLFHPEPVATGTVMTWPPSASSSMVGPLGCSRQAGKAT